MSLAHHQVLCVKPVSYRFCLLCGETISIVFISGPTIQTPFQTQTNTHKVKHTQSENSMTRCLQLRTIYCHTANTSMCT